MWIPAKHLEDMGVSSATIYRKTKLPNSEWRSRFAKREGRFGKPQKEILLEDLPSDLQIKLAQLNQSSQEAVALDERPVEDDGADTSTIEKSSPLDRLNLALKRFPLDERETWIAELQRLSNIIEKFANVNPKRIKNSLTGRYEFAPAALALCAEAACADPVIIAREPHRAQAPTPRTLDGWLRDYRKEGLLVFIRATSSAAEENSAKRDRRRAEISQEAFEWVNQNWRNYRHPTELFKAAQAKAKRNGWVIPSKVWFFRRWKELPAIVVTKHLKGEKAYMSKYAPYIPRTAEDLTALQLLCGDHRQCDVAVVWRDGRSLIRPWLTLWQCVRTGLIWGWHLDITPSSHTIGLAYAAGVIQFGAQPPARPDDGFFSYVYTDNGKDYKSRNLDGTITVHQRAAALDGGIELVRTQQRVGLYNDMDVRKMLARGYNAKEKPIERTNRDLADMDEGFDEWVGRDAKNKPDLYRDMYTQHQRFLHGKRGESPFMDFDKYLEALAAWIQKYNTDQHTRSVLENASIVPMQEYERLYTTRYEISHESLALLLMKPERRVIGKIGVGIKEGYPTWRYFHPAMSEFKGKEVEVRYDSNDLSSVWVILPNGQPCEAELVQKSSYLTPNKQSAQLMKQTESRERKMQREWDLLNRSMLRGETLEERVAAEYELEVEEVEAIAAEGGSSGGAVHKLTRMDKPKLRAVPKSRAVSVEQISLVKPDDSIFSQESEGGQVSEFDYED